MKEYKDIFDLFNSLSNIHGDMIDIHDFTFINNTLREINELGEYTGTHIPYLGHGPGKFIQLIDAGCLTNPKKIVGENDIDITVYHEIHYKGQNGLYSKTDMYLSSTYENVLVGSRDKSVWVKSEITSLSPA